MRLRGDWLAAAPLRQVMGVLSSAGHRVLIVGGAVRNDLMGLPISDVDLTSDALPDRVMALMRQAGLKVIPTGIDHGTVTVVAQGQPFEITTFRRDVETDGRHATVAFAGSEDEDAQRRDFTINALYATADGQVIDPTGGLADLPARRLRFVGDPDARIAEDYLRILRLYRFWAQYGDPDPAVHDQALMAIRPQVTGLARISHERIGAEMRKLLAARDPRPMLADMAAAGVLAIVLPGADVARGVRLIGLDLAEGATDGTALRRLAALAADDPAGTLRLSRSEDRQLSAIRAACALPDPGEAAYRHGAAAARDAVLLRRADGVPVPTDAQARIDAGAGGRLPVRAADLPHLSGTDLGRALRQIEDRWIASGFRASRDDLLNG